LLLGSAGTLSLLRSFGFKTFPFVFDESYDEINDMLARLRAIAREIEKWVGREEEFMNAMRNNRHVLEHNHNLVMNFPAGKFYADILKKATHE